MLHQPWHDRRVVAEWFLRSAFDVALDGPDDSTNQHHRVLDEAIRFFVSFHCVFRGDFCFARFSYSISERNDCRFCVALQCDFTVAKQVNEFRHPFDRPRLFDSFLQRNAAHDVLMSFFFHCNASY